MWCTISVLLAWLERKGFSVRWIKWKLKNNHASMRDNIHKMLSWVEALWLELDWAFRRLWGKWSENLGGWEILHSKLCFTTTWLDLVSQHGFWQVCKVAKSCCLWEEPLRLIAAVLRDLKAVSVRAENENALWSTAFTLLSQGHVSKSRSELGQPNMPCVLQQVNQPVLSVHLLWCGPHSGLTLFLYAVQQILLFSPLNARSSWGSVVD